MFVTLSHTQNKCGNLKVGATVLSDPEFYSAFQELSEEGGR